MKLISDGRVRFGDVAFGIVDSLSQVLGAEGYCAIDIRLSADVSLVILALFNHSHQIFIDFLRFRLDAVIIFVVDVQKRWKTDHVSHCFVVVPVMIELIEPVGGFLSFIQVQETMLYFLYFFLGELFVIKRRADFDVC